MGAGCEAVINPPPHALITSASGSPAHAHLTTPRVTAAKPGPAFNEAVLGFRAREAKHTPLCDVGVSHVLPPRGPPFFFFFCELLTTGLLLPPLPVLPFLLPVSVSLARRYKMHYLYFICILFFPVFLSAPLCELSQHWLER